MKKKLKKGATAKNSRVLFVPITKVDEEKRLVYGTMVQGGIVDKADEIFDYATSKPLFEKWSADIEKASNGKSLGNVRAMHSNIAAGKLTAIEFNDDAETIECCAKIVDDAEWTKVLEGVYTGFSIGGKYVKRWKDPANDNLYRYTASPVEVSIVDVPCVPTATFDYAKADGTVEQIAFMAVKTEKEFVPDNAAIAAKATEMAQADAAATSWVDYIDKARDALIAEDAEKRKAKEEKKKAKAGAEEDPAKEEDEADDEESNEEADEGEEGDEEGEEGADDDAEDDEADPKKKEAEKSAARNDLIQVWKATDGRTFAKKESAVEHQATINAAKSADPLSKALSGLRAALHGESTEELPEAFADLSKASKVLKFLAKKSRRDDILAKGMYEVGWFARLLDDMACIQSCVASEADWEGDNSPVPAHLKENIKQLTLTFIEMAMEEAAEMVARLKPEEVEELTDAGAGTADESTAEVDATDDPEVAVHAAEGVKFLIADKARLEKAGARNSKQDIERLQKAHDALVELGVACKAVSSDDNADDAEAAEKVAKTDLVKAETERDQLRADNERLNKIIADAVPEIEKLKKEVIALKAQPLPSAPRTSVVEKSGDRSGVTSEPALPQTLQDALAKMTPEQLQDLAIRAAQQRPMSLVDRGQK